MKINDILIERTFDATTGNVITDDSPHKTATKLAQQFVKQGMKYAKDGYGPDVVAKKMAAEFHKAVISAIDEELKMGRATRVSSYGPSRTVRAIA